jgi:hypothetical protein
LKREEEVEAVADEVDDDDDEVDDATDPAPSDDFVVSASAGSEK